ncbi:MAG: Methyltransferase corrinoid activation protein [Anaerolineae bacterium]|nr:MAG: Methyltransferase corrinoid activation protein [Anaerolineae bacterium]
MESRYHTIHLQPIGRRIQIRSDQSILEAAQLAGVEITSICGGVGVCESCRVRLVEGELSPPTIDEENTFSANEIQQGYRLACQAYPRTDIVIDIPPESLSTSQRLQLESQQKTSEIDPIVYRKLVTIPTPSINDLRSDLTRLRDALEPPGNHVEVDYKILQKIPSLCRSSSWNIQAVFHDSKLIQILPSKPESKLLGLAVDIGTTKVAAYLVDLETGAILSQAGSMNPQIAFGEDVISRISYLITHPEQRNQPGNNLLHQRIVEGLNKLIDKMLSEINDSSLTYENIVDAVVVGNTAMHHLFAGLPVEQLGISPYVPAVSEELYIPAKELGLKIAPAAQIYLPPNIAGYVGADHVAMLLPTIYPYYSDPAKKSCTVMAIDIGTNTEISLLHNQKIVSCSCASGPAFEGAHIQFGMRAAPGAIEKVQITAEEKILYKTIADQAPVGICGSGILDAIAELYTANFLDAKGTFLNNHPNIRIQNRNMEFVLVPAEKSGHNQDIVLTRRDVNEIQLAKGAIRAGINILLMEAALQPQDLDAFIIAGAFGTYIDIKSAMKIGMFPFLPLEKCQQVGNAAGLGARQMLLSKRYRQIASELANQIQYIELSNHPKFSDEFSKSLFFPSKELSN